MKFSKINDRKQTTNLEISESLNRINNKTSAPRLLMFKQEPKTNHERNKENKIHYLQEDKRIISTFSSENTLALRRAEWNIYILKKNPTNLEFSIQWNYPSKVKNKNKNKSCRNLHPTDVSRNKYKVLKNKNERKENHFNIKKVYHFSSSKLI